MPDSTMGSELMLKLYSDKLGIDPKSIRNKQTILKTVALKNLILDKIKFTDPDFKYV